MRTASKLLIMTAVCLSFGSVRADRYDDLMDKWMGKFKSSSAGYTTSTDAMQLAWNCMSAFYGLCYAYEVTKDPVLIETMSNDLKNVVAQLRKNPNGDDGFLITSADGTFKNTAATWWSDGVEYTGESFRIILGIVHWVYFIKSTPSLQATYGAQADQYLDLVENNLLKKWLDNYWIDETNDPITDFHYPGAGMIVQPHCTVNTPDPYMRYSMSSANNKHADFGLAMIQMYRITGKQKYKDLVRKAAMDYKSKLWWSDDGTYYSWAYQNPFWYKDFENEILGGKPRHGVWVEHRSGYGTLDMKFMTACYRMGIIYNKTDIERFVKTNTVIMYNNGDGWLKSDGTPPNTAASESAGPFDPLAPYDESSLLADMQYTYYNDNYTGYSARCGIPYLVHIMKMSDSELYPPDTINWVGPLEVTNLEALDRGTIRLTFYNEVDPATVADTANYDFSRGINCIGAEMDPSGNKKQVLVYSTEQAEGVAMKIRVRNVKDIYGNTAFAFPYANQPYTWTSSTIPAGISDAGRPAAIRSLSSLANPVSVKSVRALLAGNDAFALYRFSGQPVPAARAPEPGMYILEYHGAARTLMIVD